MHYTKDTSRLHSDMVSETYVHVYKGVCGEWRMSTVQSLDTYS